MTENLSNNPQIIQIPADEFEKFLSAFMMPSPFFMNIFQQSNKSKMDVNKFESDMSPRMSNLNDLEGIENSDTSEIDDIKQSDELNNTNNQQDNLEQIKSEDLISVTEYSDQNEDEQIESEQLFNDQDIESENEMMNKPIELDLTEDSLDPQSDSDLDLESETVKTDINIDLNKFIQKHKDISNSKSKILSDKISCHQQTQINQEPCSQTPQHNECHSKKNNNSDVKIHSRDKITLNVGGKRFHLKKQMLAYLNIDYNKLQIITKDNSSSIIYFLDRDPYYFSKIIDIIKSCGFDRSVMEDNIDQYSEQLISELCFYKLIDQKFCPKPKLKLRHVVKFMNNSDNVIVQIAMNHNGNQPIFEVASSILSISEFFENQLKSQSKNTKRLSYRSCVTRINLPDIDPQYFRYIINFLRTGEMYINNPKIIEMLDNFGIEYDRIENNKINNDIVTHYVSHGLQAQNDQLSKLITAFSPNQFPKLNNMGYYQFDNTNYYYPSNTTSILYGSEHVNIITTDNHLKFGTQLVFNLTDSTKNLGECIEDLLICIDIPILKPTNHVEYVDLVEYQIIESIKLVTINQGNQKIITELDGQLLYMYPTIYTKISESYHKLSQVRGKQLSVLYDNNLINIHRITIPLHLFNRQNHLPVRKMLAIGLSAHLIVQISPINKLIIGKQVDIPLLNVCLIANYFELAHNMISVKSDNVSLQLTSINAELKKEPVIYLYNQSHPIVTQIKSTIHPIYDTIIIPLTDFGYIRDFYFVIIERDDFLSNKFDKYNNALIELEILQLKDSSNLILHSRLDSVLLNSYIPLRKLGHELPPAVYYYSFSADPKQNQILGGLIGSNFFLRLKIKKINGFIKLYINEYHLELI